MGGNDTAVGHVLVRVDDLHAVVDRLRARGFTPTWGADPMRAHNVLVHVERGPFIEFFTPVPSGLGGSLVRGLVPVARRLRRGDLARFAGWADAAGPCDWALETERNLDVVRRDLAERGIDCGRTRSMRRTPPNGTELRWSVVAPSDPSLPFMMTPYVPRPEVALAAKTHANGLTAVRQLVIHHPQPDSYARTVRFLLGAGESGGSAATDTRHDVEAGNGVTITVLRGERYQLARVTVNAAESFELDVEGLVMSSTTT